MRPILFLAVLILLPSGRPAAAEALSEAERTALQATEDYRESGRERYRTLQRLKKDLRYIGEVLDRETVGEPDKDLTGFSEGGMARIAELREHGNIDPALALTVDRLESLYRELPGRRYAEPYALSLVKALAHELRWIAENGKDQEQVLRYLDEHLALPAEIEAKGYFKDGVTIKEFVAQGPITVFLAKHRLKRPMTYAKTTATDIVAAKHLVQVGVEIEGTLEAHYPWSIDGDYTFDIEGLHVELTPEWRLLHPRIPRPKTGDRVRVRGWTYYDSFHENEAEYDPEHPVLGISRINMWEIHPVMDIELLNEGQR
ncbi:MAG: hypothetical protein ABII00_14990 [Elusimicrobiota bacterium]